MPIALTDDHRALAETVAEVLRKREARAQARALLDAGTEPRPALWPEAAGLGWLGLHLPEEAGGAGYGLEELVVVVEELGRALAPGPFVPTLIASATLAALAPSSPYLPGLADGSLAAGVGLGGAVLGGGTADIILVPRGEDAVVAEAGEVTVEVPPNLDPTRRCGRVTILDQAGTVIPGGRRALTDLARLLLAAEAVGVARACTELAAEYAKVRQQFGRPIGAFQAVKHHCADMLVATELATAAVWDAARAAADGDDQRGYAAAVAAAVAGPAADLCANLATQVHGGIGFTWEHDLHMYLRRATVLRSLLEPDAAAADVTAFTAAGLVRRRHVQLPPEAEPMRAEVRGFAAALAGRPWPEQREALIGAGYAVPHWPAPYGRDAGAVEQLVIEEEFGAAGLRRPDYGITAWIILTLIQHGRQDQLDRWVLPALRQEEIWCQLFSEPEAGSDAAGIRTRAEPADGGWHVTGQKVWTSGAQHARYGLATVRTNPGAPKHQGITMMVIDMKAPGVQVRPLRQATGGADFNEVFLDQVFVPDADVVGPVDGGWAVARATLANESISIGGGGGGLSIPPAELVRRLGGRDDAGGRVGHYAAQFQAMTLLNLRRVHRAVGGAEPGPEGAVTKLVLSELGHEAAAILTALAGADAVFSGGDMALASGWVLWHRGLSIAGGTSEIKRNQIGERILGLPRDPLLR